MHHSNHQNFKNKPFFSPHAPNSDFVAGFVFPNQPILKRIGELLHFVNRDIGTAQRTDKESGHNFLNQFCHQRNRNLELCST